MKTRLIGRGTSGNEWEPVLIMWSDRYQDRSLDGSVVGRGGAHIEVNGRQRYVIGKVAWTPTSRTRSRPRWSSSTSSAMSSGSTTPPIQQGLMYPATRPEGLGRATSRASSGSTRSPAADPCGLGPARPRPDSQEKTHEHPTRGALGYLQLPTTDVAASIAFYEAVLGWRGEPAHASFEAPGLIGQWTTDLSPSPSGPVLWFTVDDLFPTLTRVTEHGGTVRGAPVLDQGERWLVEVDDPSGNRLGLVAPAPTARSQTMLMVRDVEASSRWYQELLGLTSDHGGPDYERLLADGELVLQLHHEGTDHHHGPIGDSGPCARQRRTGVVRRGQRLRRRGRARRPARGRGRQGTAPQPARGRGQRPRTPRDLGQGPRRLRRRGG